MSVLSKLALVLAVATSGLALYDALVGGTTGELTFLDAESGMSLGLMLGSVIHAAAYVILALLLRAHADRIDAGSKVRRGLRIGLAVSYVLMAVFFGPVITYAWATGTDPDNLPGLLAVPAGLGFVGLFAFTIALGMALLKVAGMRMPGLVLTGVVAGLGVTALLGALGSDFAHPAYPETLAYIGTALTGIDPLARVRSTREAHGTMSWSTRTD
jgi:hypothetical protein